MENHARTYAAFVRKEAEDLFSHEGDRFRSSKDSVFIDAITKVFQGAMAVGAESGGFIVDSIALVDDNFRPVAVVDKKSGPYESRYASELAKAIASDTIEIARGDSRNGSRIGMVMTIIARADLFPGKSFAVAVEIDQSASMRLHDADFARYEALAIGVAILAELLQALILHRLVSTSAVRPARLISSAMEDIERGRLETRIELAAQDEFGTMANRFNGMAAALEEKERLSKYVSESTKRAVRAGAPSGGGFREPIRARRAILFSDIRGFTAFTESNEPEIVIRVLNRLLDLQATAIGAFGGIIDKFVGDEIMATFDDERPATLCALKIVSLVAASREELAGLRVGIGINAGSVVEGDVGSEDLRDFTVIGDTVNLAARLEAMAGPGEVLIPTSLLSQSRMSILSANSRGLVLIKGKSGKIAVSRVEGVKTDARRRGASATGRE